MDRFHEMAVFVAVAEEESFSVASRRLSMSAPAVTRVVAGLEDRLGIQLLNRTTRYVRVTTAGQRYLDDARLILDDLDAADESVSGITNSSGGEVSIVAPEYFAGQFVVPVVDKFFTHHPSTKVSIVSVDQPANPAREGFDVDIRFGVVPNNVTHTVVGQFHEVYIATPAYLQAHGTPQTPADLHVHTLIENSKRVQAGCWKPQKQKDSANFSQGKTPRVSFSSVDACLSAASSNFGIARLASYQVADEIANGQYQLVLGDFPTPSYQINIVHPQRQAQSKRVRDFVDLLIEHLLSAPEIQRKETFAENQHGLTSYIPRHATNASQMLRAV